MNRLFQLAFFIAAALALLMASLPFMAVLPGHVTDKLVHIAAFAALAVLAALAFPRARLVLLFVALALLGAAIEVFQIIPFLGRTASVTDWLADIFAIAIVLFAIAGVRHYSSSRVEPS